MSICRSAVGSVRFAAVRSKTVLSKPSISPRRASIVASRPLASTLGSFESLWPLHNATASAQLISNLAVHTSCWSWVSQGLVKPS